MIAQIHSGSGFGGLVRYANDIQKKDTNIIASEGVSLTSDQAMVAGFRLQAKMRPTLWEVCRTHLLELFARRQRAS